ncbi:hypothetical protein ACFFQW_05695 [Umezawaea endophytica]|uniref:Uncharacterized protein n=1 Tax=Umezawaea endophytica TaxID=1654476 RepID=A0A9X2VGC6_9PSEU|nr:hypothetical protein [Umezawaea endophytica]MCS7476133.1 hypothetical protein [Umezawaea endophytica]
MTRRALLAVLALIAGFAVVALPQSDQPDQHTAAVTALVQAVHLPTSTTRSNPTNIQQQGFIGHAPVDLTHRARPIRLRVLIDVAQRVHRAPETISSTPLGDRAPPATSV